MQVRARSLRADRLMAGSSLRVVARRGRRRSPVRLPAAPFSSTARLVRRAQAGSERAFALLWRRYAPLVHGILLGMVQQADAEDLSQEVAISALQSLDTLARPQRFAAWLCVIARNVGRDALRARRGRDVTLDAAENSEAPAQGDRTLAAEILQEIRALPECYREPLLLRLLLDMTGPEIALRMGMTEGSIRVNLCRGMKLLRRRLQQLGVAP